MQQINEFPDQLIKERDQVNHSLIGNAKVLKIVGSVAEIVAERDGKHYKVQMSSLHRGHVEMSESSLPLMASMLKLQENNLAFGKRDWEAESENKPHDMFLKYKASGGPLSREQWEEDRSNGNSEDKNYAEELASKLDDNLTTEDEILEAGFKLAVEDLGKKRARFLFSYDEDFPSDFVSAYNYKNS